MVAIHKMGQLQRKKGWKLKKGGRHALDNEGCQYDEEFEKKILKINNVSMFLCLFCLEFKS